MKEINIGRCIVEKRKSKGITQEQLASYMGISKASVSKWETGQSYPDIVLLPQLATYFGISIDELIGYEPQMSKEDIKKSYHELARRFSVEPFEEVIKDCKEKIKKYYSCFPFLLQMGILLINYYSFAKDEKDRKEIIELAKQLFIRVRENSEEVYARRQAVSLQALCAMLQKNPTEVIDLVEETTKLPVIQDNEILASAYQMMGEMDKSREVLQIGIYQNIVELLSQLTCYLALANVVTSEKFERVVEWVKGIDHTFNMKELHPVSIIRAYLAAAQGYMAKGRENPAKALELLEQYARGVMNLKDPIKLHGDVYFDKVEDWLESLELGREIPSDFKSMRSACYKGVADNPAFESLRMEDKYKIILKRLKGSMENENR